MRKFIATLMLALVCIVMFSACGKTQEVKDLEYKIQVQEDEVENYRSLMNSVTDPNIKFGYQKLLETSQTLLNLYRKQLSQK